MTIMEHIQPIIDANKALIAAGFRGHRLLVGLIAIVVIFTVFMEFRRTVEKYRLMSDY